MRGGEGGDEGLGGGGMEGSAGGGGEGEVIVRGMNDRGGGEGTRMGVAGVLL